MKFSRLLFLILYIVLIFTFECYSQIQRGTYTARHAGVMRGNQVRTVFTNFGAIGQPGFQGPMVAWKYDNNGYVGIGTTDPSYLLDVNGNIHCDNIYANSIGVVDTSNVSHLSPGIVPAQVALTLTV